MIMTEKKLQESVDLADKSMYNILSGDVSNIPVFIDIFQLIVIELPIKKHLTAITYVWLQS